jgi:uncharacterized protein YndB with AHSA1/START domain
VSAKIEAKVSRRFAVSAEQVYDAWLDPVQARAWMTSSLRSHGLAGDIRRFEIDPRVGGKFFFSDQRGEIEAKHWGTYLELDRPRKIVFTWIVDASEEADPSRVTLTLVPEATGCTATIVHQMDAKWHEYVARTEAGWARMLEHIDQLLSAKS